MIEIALWIILAIIALPVIIIIWILLTPILIIILVSELIMCWLIQECSNMVYGWIDLSIVWYILLWIIVFCIASIYLNYEEEQFN